MTNPYQTCPVYIGGRFTLRLVTLDDAADLLTCYADPAAAPIFNSDNCTSDFVFSTVEAMERCIRFWLADYACAGYVRFSIVDRGTGRAVGTVECFARPGEDADYGRTAMLRLDLPSRYETREDISELLGLLEAHLYEDFGVESVLTKAIPAAVERVAALRAAGFVPVEGTEIISYGDYYIKRG